MNDMKQKDDTMRATPETDAAFRDGYTFCAEDMMPAVAFCANLERERDEARELARELLSTMQSVKPWIGCPSTPDEVEYKFSSAIEKAKEVLGEA
jgi:hypothetical protein